MLMMTKEGDEELIQLMKGSLSHPARHFLAQFV
jgi:hypothetical protein